MIEHAQVPAVILLVGMPDNGKTTCSNWFEKLLKCPIVHTDQVYLAWVKEHYPKQYRSAKNTIRGHFPGLSADQKLAWNTHVTEYILKQLKKAPVYLVVEGWLMLFWPAELRQLVEQCATLIPFTMKRFNAYGNNGAVFKPKGRNYTRVVNGILSCLSGNPVVVEEPVEPAEESVEEEAQPTVSVEPLVYSI
jgi:hypothetical protein